MKAAKGYFIGLGIGLNMFFAEYTFMFCQEDKSKSYQNVYRK